MSEYHSPSILLVIVRSVCIAVVAVRAHELAGQSP
jgi:hypothetical protein